MVVFCDTFVLFALVTYMHETISKILPPKDAISERVLTFLKLKSELDLSAKASTWSSAKTGVETTFPKYEKLMEKVRFFERSDKSSERVASF